MAGFKLNRINEDVRRELMDILRNMKDPRISGGMISIVRVEVTNDLSHCKVYISALEGMEKAKEYLEEAKKINSEDEIVKQLVTMLKGK